MEQNNTLQVITISGACCLPHLAKQDKALETALQQAIARVAFMVEVREVSLSALLAGHGDLTSRQRAQVLALFQRYNTAFTPAVMVNDKVLFAGKLPTVDQLTDALQSAAALPA